MKNENNKSISKKGQLEISFNWIFILLAGGAILIFFIFVITKESDQSSDITNYQIVKRMDSLLAAVEQNPLVMKDLGHLSSKIDFACQDGLHVYALKEGKNNPELKTQLVFTPESLGDARLWAWTKDYGAPYPVSSLLYLSDSKTLYVFQKDSFVITELYENFADNFTKLNAEISFIRNMKDTGINKYILVVSKLGYQALRNNMGSSIRSKITFVVIDDTNPSLYPGKVAFYKYRTAAPYSIDDNTPGVDYESPYTSEEMLYGAIVTGDKSLYECIINKLMKKNVVVDRINTMRLKALEPKFSSLDICRTFMGGYTISVIQEKTTRAQGFIDDTNDWYIDFYDRVKELERTRNEMLRQGCPTLY